MFQVREIASILDLDVLYYPCPRNGPQYRLKVLQLGGKQQFPYMVIFQILFWYFLKNCIENGLCVTIDATISVEFTVLAKRRLRQSGRNGRLMAKSTV